MLSSLAVSALLSTVPDARVVALERLAEDGELDVLDLDVDRGLGRSALTFEVAASVRWVERDGQRGHDWVVWAAIAVRPEAWWGVADDTPPPPACAKLAVALSPLVRARALDALGCGEVGL